MLAPLSEREGIMQTMRLMGVVLIAATWMGVPSSTARADTNVWSTNAASCVPESTSGLSVAAGAVTAAAGATVTLYCGITNADLGAGGFNVIEIVYKGGGFVLPPLPLSQQPSQSSTSQQPSQSSSSQQPSQSSIGNLNQMAAIILTGGVVTSELIEMSKATGEEAPKPRCAIQSRGSSVITREKILCDYPGSQNMDWLNNFYYLRIILKSGTRTGQQMTVYGTSLIYQ
jgi:hypothetical protein